MSKEITYILKNSQKRQQIHIISGARHCKKQKTTSSSPFSHEIEHKMMKIWLCLNGRKMPSSSFPFILIDSQWTFLSAALIEWKKEEFFTVKKVFGF